MLKLLHLAGILYSILFALSAFAHTYDVTLAWDPNSEPYLAKIAGNVEVNSNSVAR